MTTSCLLIWKGCVNGIFFRYMHISEQHATMMESEEMANQVLAKLTDQHINAQMRDPKISKEQKEKVKATELHHRWACRGSV